MYTIKTVTTLTGINTETLRAWERRYGTVAPVRDHKGRRLYSQDDVERLTLLASATQQGFTISKIANLPKSELQALLVTSESSQTVNQSLFFVQIVEALSQYQMARCEELLKRALVAMEPLSYARDILLPTLHKIGDLWHAGKLSVAQEHLFSACVKRIVLSMVNNMQPFSGGNPGIMFVTPSGEYHEFGILLSCLLAANQQCTCYYMGPDLPWVDISQACHQLKPAIIALGIVNAPPAPGIIESLSQLSEDLPRRTELWLGGAGAQFLYQQEQLPGHCLYTSSLDDFHGRVARWIAKNRA